MIKKLFAIVLVSLVAFTSLGFASVKVNAERAEQSTAYDKLLENVEEKSDALIFNSEAINNKLEVVKLENKIERIVEKEKDGAVKIYLSGTRERLNNDNEVEEVKVKEEILIVSETEIYINGDKVSEEDLMTNAPMTEKITPFNSGGYSWLTRWSQNTRGDYNVRSYATADVFMEEGRGGYRSKNISTGSSLNLFKNYEATVTSKRLTIVNRGVVLTAALGIGAGNLLWGNVIGALTGGGVMAKAAWDIYTASSDGREKMRQAYNLLGTL